MRRTYGGWNTIEHDSSWAEARTGAGPQQISEPSDVIPGDTSTPYTLAIGGSETGVVNFVGDHDWFGVQLTAGQSYVFTMDGSGSLSDTYLELYNASGTLLAFDDDGQAPGGGSLLRFTASTTGTYYLNARAFEDASVSNIGDYTVTAAIGPPQNPLDTIDLHYTAPLHIDVYFATAGQTFNGEHAVRSWTTAEKNSAMAALATWAAVTPLTFSITTNSASAEFVLTLATLDANVLGQFVTTAGVGYGTFAPTGYGWSTAGLAPGGAGFTTLIHEFGHGLGLAHPHDNGGGSEIMQGVTSAFNSFGTYELNQGVFTVMSYNDGWQLSPAGAGATATIGNEATPGPLDIALVQQKYGIKGSANVGDTVYTLSATDSSYKAIWDTSGIDTIAFNGSQNATIDLHSATLLSEIGGGGIVSYVSSVQGGLTIANGVVIENATGGSGNDTITGNEASNLLNGSGGNDTLVGAGGTDTLLGGAGDDTLVAKAGDIADGGSGSDSFNLDLSSTSAAVVYDMTKAASAAGLAIAGGSVSNAEMFQLQSGSGDDTLKVTGGITGQSYWYGGGGVDHVSVDFSMLSGDTSVGVSAVYMSGGGGVTIFGAESVDFKGGAGNDQGTGGDLADSLIGNGGLDFLYGNGGDDVLDGGAGNDSLYGGTGNDQLVGGDGNDLIVGNEGADTITGGAGDDFLAGGGGGAAAAADWIDGGDGRDKFELYFFGLIAPMTFHAADAASATGVTFASGAHVQNCELFDLMTGSADDQVFADASNFGSIWRAGDGVDRLTLDLSGVTGATTMTYSIADPIAISGLRIDVHWDGVSFTAMYAEALSISSGSGADTLIGYNYNDVFSSGAGADVLNGAAGDDTLDGGGGADVLDGGTGVDTMIGGLGDDTYFVDNGGDVVTENASEGTDTIRATVGVAVLAANVENLVLLATAVTGNGNGLSNIITGNASNNFINGLTGADTMIGGLGNDTYFVDVAGDVVTENSGEGADTIFSTISLTLAQNVENLTLTGTALNATGNFLNNVLTGDAQKNTLNGGSGEDTLAGGLDSDTYIYNSAGDVITEAVNAGLADTVIAFIDVGALMANVEYVTLAGTATSAVGNELNNILTGNSLANTLTGGLGNDQLNGALGADTLIGGEGDDSYLVENAGDVVTENASEGNDVVYTWVTLPVLFDNVERATIIGAGNLDITGNGLDNRLYGNDNNNTLNGGVGADILGGLGGDDHLFGGAGRDQLTGNAGNDTFVYQAISDSGATGASRDIINDFTQGQDLIDVSAIDADSVSGGQQQFAFVGVSAFSNTAGELRYDLIDNPSGTDYTIISMDVNGDGVADSQITLVGLVTLTQSDFIFGP